ncbi:MAG: ABC transporter substrate-binding protein [Pyrobaculum sp.]
MRIILLIFLLTISAFSTTILTRADAVSIQTALPIIQKYIPDVNIIPADPTQWRSLIEQGVADFLWAGAPVLYESLYKEGYLAPLPNITELNLVPDSFGDVFLKRYGPDGKIYYVVYGFLAYVIGYRDDLVKKSGLEPVCSWRDLSSDQLFKYFIKSRSRPIVIARPTKSTSTTAMFQLVLEIYGWEVGWKYLTAMAAMARFVDSSSAARDYVARGEALFAPMVDYYVFISGLDYCIPADGTDILFDPVAVPRGANYTAAAVLLRVFLTEVVKKAVDRYIMPSNLAVLNASDVDATKAAVLKRHLEKLSKAKIVHVPVEKGASYYYSFIYYYEATLVDLQDLLIDVWTELLEAYLGGRISNQTFERLWAELARPLAFVDPQTGELKTFTYDVAVSLNEKIVKDPAYREALYSTWREAARSKYLKVREELRTAASAQVTHNYIVWILPLLFVVIYLILRKKRS